jgi:succinate dehydrogenase hydrophobic anchor subunit
MHVGIVVKKVMVLASVPSPKTKHGSPRIRRLLRRVGAVVMVLVVVGILARRIRMRNEMTRIISGKCGLIVVYPW